MKNLIALSEKINKTVYQIVNGKMQQTQRNNLRANIEEELSKDFKEIFDQCYLTKDGVVILLPNEEEGQIEISVSVKIPMIFTDTKEKVDIVEHFQTIEEEFLESKEEKKLKSIEKANKQKENKDKAKK